MTHDQKDPVHLHARTDESAGLNESAATGDGGCPRPASCAKFSGSAWTPLEGPSWTDRDNWSALARCDTPEGDASDRREAR